MVAFVFLDEKGKPKCLFFYTPSIQLTRRYINILLEFKRFPGTCNVEIQCYCVLHIFASSSGDFTIETSLTKKLYQLLILIIFFSDATLSVFMHSIPCYFNCPICRFMAQCNPPKIADTPAVFLCKTHH